jgi:hypothetical protein
METTKTLKKSAWRRAVLLAGIGVVSAGSVAGVSVALSSNSTPAPSTHVASGTATSSNGSAFGKIRKARIQQVLRRAVSGQIELSTKNGFVTVDFNRGAVTAISSSSITVLRADGQHETAAISSSTHMPKRGTPADGQQVVVVSEGGNTLYVFDLGSPGSSSKKASTPAKATSSAGSTT